MTWLLSLWTNPLVRKASIYAVVLLAIFFAIRYYGNRQYAQGATAGRAAATVEVERAMAVKMAEAQAEIDKLRTSNDAERSVLENERGKLQGERAAIRKEMDDALFRSSFNQEQTCEIVAAIAGTDLDAALRAQSAKLAAANRH